MPEPFILFYFMLDMQKALLSKCCKSWCIYFRNFIMTSSSFNLHSKIVYDIICYQHSLSLLKLVLSAVTNLQPRVLAWMHFLHLSLSSAIVTDSSTVSPIHVLMLSIQAVRGLPHLRAPGIVPCIISFSRQLPCFLTV